MPQTTAQELHIWLLLKTRKGFRNLFTSSSPRNNSEILISKSFMITLIKASQLKIINLALLLHFLFASQLLIYSILSFARSSKNLKPPHRRKNQLKETCFLVWLNRLILMCLHHLNPKLPLLKENLLLLTMKICESLLNQRHLLTVLEATPLSESSSLLLHSCYSSPFWH